MVKSEPMVKFVADFNAAEMSPQTLDWGRAPAVEYFANPDIGYHVNQRNIESNLMLL